MEIDYSDIVIIVGNYGSGKTEVSINLAAKENRSGKHVEIADLDLVNPYFRSREARKQLQSLGVMVVLPEEQYMVADLPILSPSVAALIKKRDVLAILDAGGNGVGATVLSALADALKGRPVKMLQVVNPYRPYTDTVSGCAKIRDEIESASKLRVTGIIGNANLMNDTQREHILEGYDFIKRVSEKSGLPTEFITVPDVIKNEIREEKISCPILTIRRQLVPPWQRKEKLI